MKHTFHVAALGGLLLTGLSAVALAQDPAAHPPHGIAAGPATEAPVGEPAGVAPAGEPGHDAPEHAAPEHGVDPAGEHGAAEPGAEHGEGHGAAGGHADPLHYSGDEDHDGTANWMDSDSENFVLSGLGFHFLNFLIFGGLLFKFARPVISDGLRARAAAIKTGIVDAAKLREEAVARNKAVSARLDALSKEIAEMSARAEIDARAEEARIIERAQGVARQVGETAQRQIADEAARARRAIRDDAVVLAVQLAEGIVTAKLQAGDQKRLADEFLAALKSEGRHV